MPKNRKTSHGIELCRQLKYLSVSKDVVSLKEKHVYYGQIQLGLALCNIEKAKLLIYVPCINDVCVIDVPLNRHFVCEFTAVLFDVYFDRFLPFLTANIDRLSIKRIPSLL